jgi:hypothetical protein
VIDTFLSIPGGGGPEVTAALDIFRPAGNVLELACGPGMWTELLLRDATSVTAVDAAFVDDAFRPPEELIEGESSSTIQRRLGNGTAYRAVKVRYRPSELERQLASLGWRFTVTQTSGPFYWGAGARAGVEPLRRSP